MYFLKTDDIEIGYIFFCFFLVIYQKETDT